LSDTIPTTTCRTRSVFFIWRHLSRHSHPWQHSKDRIATKKSPAVAPPATPPSSATRPLADRNVRIQTPRTPRKVPPCPAIRPGQGGDVDLHKMTEALFAGLRRSLPLFS